MRRGKVAVPGKMDGAERAVRANVLIERIGMEGRGVRFQYISVGETVAIREVAVPLVPFAELEADILGMYVKKESWTVNRLLGISSTAFIPKQLSCLLVLENERRRRHRLDVGVIIVQTEWWEGKQYTTAVKVRPLC